MRRDHRKERGTGRLPIACDLSSLDADQGRRRRELQELLRKDVREVRELEDGYAFRHPPKTSVLLELAEFVALERQCCPFFDFVVEIGRNGGPVWFRITGDKEAKRVLQAQLKPVPTGRLDAN
jgi:hypothetical protein